MASALGDLAAYHVPESQDIFYIPDFVSPEEEQYLIRKISESPQPKWKKLPNRRLQIWGGELTTKNQLIPQPLPTYLNEFPDIIGRIRDTGVFSNSPHGVPNHIIMNEYLPGQGIMAHEDGPSYHPVVATLSLGSHTTFHYYEYKQDTDITDGGSNSSNGNGRLVDTTPIMSVLLEPRSLVITASELYSTHLHGIDHIVEDVFPAPEELASVTIANTDLIRGKEYKDVLASGGVLERDVRYSLTCRDVERVVKLNTRMGVRPW